MAGYKQVKPRWKKGESGNPAGRPKKLLSVLKGEGFKKVDIEACLQSMLSLNVEELKEIHKDPEASILEVTLASALRKSLALGDLSALESILNRVHGRPIMKTEITGADGQPLVPISLVVRDQETANEVLKLEGK